jgi:GT2 family glycosyltransferase
MLSRLAKRGWPVLYARLVVEDPIPQDARLEAASLAPGVSSVSLALRRHADPFRESLNGKDTAALVRQVLGLRRRMHLEQGVVLCQLPFWWPLARALRNELGWPVVYDRMDMHRGFAATDERALHDEQELVHNADLVWVVSQFLEEASAGARRVEVIHNGCDWPHWSEPGPPPAGLPPPPVIGFYGAIAEWIDTDLIWRLALARSEWSFLLIGSTWGADVARLAALPNVHLTGEIPYQALPAYAARFDVGLIPFRRVPLTVAGDPVKLYEMLALGIDIVSTPLPEVQPFGDVIELAEGVEAWLRAIERCLGRPRTPELVELRRARARATSWEARVDQAERSVVELYPLVSIVMVTFGNRDLTRLCLQSLWGCTAYPRFEVVAVDNASGDGTVAMLEEMAAAHPELRVIANATNRGFAAATNQGVQAARGDVLCLLNNDTVVTDGWLSVLVDAVWRDPTLGMVGPLSNAVANEARIPVGYAALEEMPLWAAGWIREHDGESFPIPMLALFCTVMRRAVWERVGPLDEQFGLGMFEDDDYSRRVRAAGFDLRCRRDAFVHHWQRAGFKLLGDEAYMRLYETNQARFRAKWGS